METENNVVAINGQEYIIDNFNDNQKYYINQIRDLQLKANSLRFQLDQVVVAQDKFTEELIKTVEVEEEEVPQLNLN
jgi:DNA integrity scanning protein DisA with diadenylate cyclase activity